jgi:peptide/nickel transport system substrate-binding protein
MKHSKFLALGAAAALAVGLAACAPSAPEPGESSGSTGPSDETLSIGTTTDVVNFNPVLGNSRTDSWITNLMYPHLLSISDDGTKEAHVATDWGYVDDTTGFYEIRDDLTWSDGETSHGP